MAVKNCQHPNLSGYGTVEIVLHFCEVGDDCPGLAAGCPYSYRSSELHNE